MTADVDLLARADLPPEDRRRRAHLLARMGDGCRRAGDPDAAQVAYEAALADAPLGVALAGLGHLAVRRGDPAAARAWFERAAARLAEEGLPGAATEAASNAACMRYAQGEHAEAAAELEGTLAARRARGDASGELLDLLNLGHCRLALGEDEAALGRYGEAAAAAERLGDGPALGAASAGLGQALLRRGDVEAAAAALERATGLHEASGDPTAAATARLGLADAWCRAGRSLQAVAAYRGALAVLGGRLPPGEAARVWNNLGSALYDAREVAQALEAFEAGLALGASGPAARHLLGNRGLARVAAGQVDQARPDLERALAAHQAHGERAHLAAVATALSDACRYQGDLAGALAHHRLALEVERELGRRREEPGGLVYAPVTDRALGIPEGRGVAAPGTELAELPPPPGERPVVLLAPPATGVYGPLFPRGAASIASFLVHHGVPAVVLPLSEYVDVHAGAAALGAQTRALVERALAEYRPRAVAISVTFSYLYPQGLELARLAREVRPDVPIAIGGPHVTYWDGECLAEEPSVDVVVRGEGEWTVLEWVRTVEAGGDLARVAGITWRDGAAVRKNPRRPLGDVRGLPPVAFELLPRSFCERMEVTGLTSRGCRFKCTFCHEFRHWGAVVRDHPPRRLIGELERLATNYGNTLRGIDDSMLSMLEPGFFELCGLLERSPHRPERFNLLTRIDTVTPEGLAAMKAAGIRSLSIGLESGSEQVLRAMNKGFDLEAAERGLQTIRAAGVDPAAFFIVGHPGDGPAASEQTLAWIDRLFREGLIAWIDPAIFTPYPGTPPFINPEAFGVRILTRDWTRWRRSNRPIAELEGFAAGEIYLTYLRMLELQAGHHRRRAAPPHSGLRTPS